MPKTPKYSVRIYPTDEDGIITSASFTELTDVLSIDIQKGIETTKDVFSFEIPYYEIGGNWQNYISLDVRGDNKIRINDVIGIFANYNGNITDNDLLFFGIVKKFNLVNSQQKLTIKVSGANRTEELLKGMIPYTTVLSDKNTETPPDIIINMINRLNKHNSSHKIYAVKDTETIEIVNLPGGIQSTKKDNTSFGSVAYSSTWKPIYFQIEQISDTEYTEDPDAGTYLFYVKPVPVLSQFQLSESHGKPGPFADVLYWHSPTTEFSGSLIEGSGITGMTLSFDVKDIVNAMIINAGKDLNDHGVITVAYDVESMSKYGTRWAYYTKSMRKFSQLFEREVTLGSESGSVFDAQTHFPPIGSYPWTMHFNPNFTATDDRTFNTLLRTEAKRQAEEEALAVIEKNKNARWDCMFDLELGSHQIQLGDIYYFQIPSMGWEGTATKPGKLLRIREEVQILDQSGWQTRYIAKEDEEVIRSQLNN